MKTAMLAISACLFFCLCHPTVGQTSYLNTSDPGLDFRAYATPSSSNDAFRNEFKMGYGWLSGAEFAVGFGYGLASVLGTSISIGIGDVVSIIVDGVPTNVTVTRLEDDSKYYGAALLNYNRFAGKRASFGLQASYAPLFFKSIVHYSNGRTSTEESRADIVQVYARFDYRYILKPRFQMYSGVMAGWLLELQYGDSGFAPHINLLGLRFGQKGALYAELGIGLSSIFSAGYSARF